MTNIRNILLPFSICFLIAISIYPNTTFNPITYSTEGLSLNYNSNKDLALSNFEPITSYSPVLGKSFHGFKEALAFKESRGDYFTVNTLGYLGKYQFGASTLKLLGVHNTETFLNSPELQEKAFMANAQRNKWVLRKFIKRYAGKIIGGVKVTESGILAAAHLSGPGNVKRFLRTAGHANSSDAYGASVKYYMKRFQGYNTALVKPVRRPKVKL